MTCEELSAHIVAFLRTHQGKRWEEVQQLLGDELRRIGASATKVTVT